MNGTRVNARLIASTLGLLLGLAGCASDRVASSPESAQPAEPVKPPEIKVGLLLPLSGPAEAIGRDMLDAAQMALFDVGDGFDARRRRSFRATRQAPPLARAWPPRR